MEGTNLWQSTPMACQPSDIPHWYRMLLTSPAPWHCTWSIKWETEDQWALEPLSRMNWMTSVCKSESLPWNRRCYLSTSGSRTRMGKNKEGQAPAWHGPQPNWAKRNYSWQYKSRLRGQEPWIYHTRYDVRLIMQRSPHNPTHSSGV